MKSSHRHHLRHELGFDSLMAALSEHFSLLNDPRCLPQRSQYSLSDVLKSAFAMFALKSPSLLNFQTRTRTESGNLQRVFGIKEIPGDTQMRAILDEVPSSTLDYSFAELIAHLGSAGVLDTYRYAVAQNALIVSVDGVEHFLPPKFIAPAVRSSSTALAPRAIIMLR